MKKKKKEINIILKNYLLGYLNKINKFYIKSNTNLKKNSVYCFIKDKKIFFYIKEKNFILLTNRRLNILTNKNFIFKIKNLFFLIKIFILNNSFKVIVKKKYLYILGDIYIYKIRIYNLILDISDNIKYIYSHEKLTLILIIKNKKFIDALKLIFFNLKYKNSLIRGLNIYLKIYKNSFIFYTTNFTSYLLKYKIKTKINYNDSLFKLSKKSLLIYKNIFIKYNKILKIYLCKNRYIYIKSLKNIFILKVKEIKQKNIFNKILKFYKYSTKIIKINNHFINKFIKVYNIINKSFIINIIKINILKKKIILLYNNKNLFLKEFIYYPNYTLNGLRINVKINLYIFIKTLVNINNNKTDIYINKNNILVKNINKNFYFYGFITNIK